MVRNIRFSTKDSVSILINSRMYDTIWVECFLRTLIGMLIIAAIDVLTRLPPVDRKSEGLVFFFCLTRRNNMKYYMHILLPHRASLITCAAVQVLHCGAIYVYIFLVLVFAVVVWSINQCI